MSIHYSILIGTHICAAIFGKEKRLEGNGRGGGRFCLPYYSCDYSVNDALGC